MKTGFGWIEVGGTRYEHDIVIHRDRSVTKREKKRSKPFKKEYGHTPLTADELGFLADERPEVVYIGTGQYGDLPIAPDARTVLSGYTERVAPTPEILEEMTVESRVFSAVLHVTC
jgi:hypothetical protein